MKITAKDYDNNYFKPLVEAYVNQNSWSMNRVSRLDVIDVNGKFVLDIDCGMGTFTSVKKEGKL